MRFYYIYFVINVGNRIHNSVEQNRPYEPGSHSECQ